MPAFDGGSHVGHHTTDAVPEPAMRVLKRPPLPMLVARRLPFSYLSKHYLSRWNMLDAFAPFRFHGGRIVVPLDEYDVWYYLDLNQYHLNRVRNFAAIADRMMPAFDFIDCGAHLGLFSAQFSRQSRNLRSIVAFEPNRTLFRFLESNIRAGGFDNVTVLPAALADFRGKGQLRAPDYDPTSSQALFIEPDPAGDIEVMTLDDIADRVGSAIALKLDIEGTELEVLRGGRDFIRSLQQIVICLEFHRKVLARIGRTDVGMLAEIETIRKLRWVNADDPTQVIDPRRSVWEQTNTSHQCDLIGLEDG